MKIQNFQTNRFVNRLFSGKHFFCALLLGVTATAPAQITPGNLVIYRVGDGTGALGTTATSVFLDEYTTLGAFVQSIALPTTGGSAFTATGNSTTEGIISRSQDGSSLIYTGYRKAAGGTSPAADNYNTTRRVIGTLTAAGTVNTATVLTNDGGAITANAIRSATSVDGTSAFWVSTATRVSYDAVGLGSGGTTQIDLRNSRQVNLSGNTLYAANGSTAITGKVQTYGTLPTGATAANPIVSLTTADAVNGFVLMDLDPGTAGDDTLYALSTVENLLRKYHFNGASWVADGSISASNSVNLTGYVIGTTANLFLTSGSSLFAYSDASGFGGTETGALGAAIAASGLNTAFRGIGLFAPVPEPSVMGLAAVGAAMLVWRRRRA